MAHVLLSRYQTLEGVFCALVNRLDEGYGNHVTQHAVAKPDLAHLLVTLAEADYQEPQIDSKLFTYLVQTLGNRQDEALLALFLGSKSSCLDVQILAYGSEREVTIGTRRLLRAAIQCGATSMILAHNHPSGNIEPSRMDYQSTLSAEAAAKVVGVELIDHLIVAGQQVFSIRHSCCVRG